MASELQYRLVVIHLTFLFCGYQASAFALQYNKPKCEKMNISVCSDMPYGRTLFPNYLLHHETQLEAEFEIDHFRPLIDRRCSSLVKEFLCIAYAPVCTNMMIPLYPCRSFCRTVKRGCASLLRAAGIPLPDVLKCKNFPKASGNWPCVHHRQILVAKAKVEAIRKKTRGNQ